MYPVCPGSTQFILTSPLFENAVIRLANGKELRITANNPAKNTYIKEVFWNDKPIAENFVTYNQLMEGGNLKFVLDAKPNLKRGISPETYPYSLSENNEVSIPYISNDISFFEKEVAVNCGSATQGTEIRYTTDGTTPNEKSTLYTNPFTIGESATIKLKAFKSGFEPSITASYQASKCKLKPASQLKLTKNGVNFRYYEGDFSRTSDLISIGKFIKSGTCDQPNLSVAQIPDHFGIIFSGFVYAPSDGVYTFSTQSDDGSLFRIEGQTVVDNDGSHAEIRAIGRIALKKGFHPYELLYFESYEGEALKLNWILPGTKNEEQIPSKNLFIN